MADTIFIDGDGVFEIDGHNYRIPRHFSSKDVRSYRSLLVPVPDIPGGTKLTAEQRSATEAFLFRRAAACVIPGFWMSVSESLSAAQLQSINRWIALHRPSLSEGRPLHA